MFGEILTWVVAAGAALQLILTAVHWNDPWAFSHRLMWAWNGETPP